MSRGTSLLRFDTTLPPTVTCATRHCPGPSTLLGRESVPTSANVSCVCRVRRTCRDSRTCPLHAGCHLKCHKEHADRGESAMQPCVGGTELVLVLEFYTLLLHFPCPPPPFLQHYPSPLFHPFIYSLPLPPLPPVPFPPLPLPSPFLLSPSRPPASSPSPFLPTPVPLPPLPLPAHPLSSLR